MLYSERTHLLLKCTRPPRRTSPEKIFLKLGRGKGSRSQRHSPYLAIHKATGGNCEHGLRVQGDCWKPDRQAVEDYEIITMERYWSFSPGFASWKMKDTLTIKDQRWSCSSKAPKTQPQGPFKSAVCLRFTLNFSRTPWCPIMPLVRHNAN